MSRSRSASALVLVASFCTLAAYGRVPQRTMQSPSEPEHQEAQSELATQNYDRVAATAAQLKEVLIADAGIMVEVKRMIAKEASDNGQIVKDEDLTSQAVFDRLEMDVKFRSAVTSLVRRYGYLKPQLNPFSEEAKQEEFVLKERARTIVQIEAQRDAMLMEDWKDARKAQRAAALQNRPCPVVGLVQDASAGTADGCQDAGSVVPKNNQSIPNENPNVSPPQNLSVPSVPQPAFPPQGSILRAQSGGSEQSGGMLSGGMGSMDSMSSTSLGGSMGRAGTPSLENVSNPMSPMSAGMLGGSNSGANGGGGLGSGGFDIAAMSGFGGAGGGGLQSLVNMNSVSEDAVVRANVQPGSPLVLRNNGARSEKATFIAPDAVIHRPSPYNDIPSLYDLYVQAPMRTGAPQRFGAEVFRDGLRDPRAIPMDMPVGPDYVVGPGDSLSIDLWGGVTTRLVRAVDREGRVALPEAGPVQVSGRSLSEVQQIVQKALGTQFRDTSTDVSVSHLRTVRVYVVGEVAEPGAYDISSLSTPLNAVVAANGVTSRGSLRFLKHYRGRQLLEQVDAYDLLLRGVTPDAKKLENGDTLMVPPLGPQVTVTGMVRRPAVYELREEKTLADVLDLAGGILPAATLKHVEVQRLEAHEKRTMLSLDLSAENGESPELNSFQVKDGDQIHIFPIAPYNQDSIYLLGHVLKPGRYSYRDGMTIKDLVSSYKDLLPEPAAHYAEIIRLNPPDFHPTVESFDLTAAFANPESAPKLKALDTVKIYSRFDFEPAPSVWVAGEVRAPGKYNTSGQVHLRDAVYLAGGLLPDAEVDDAQLFRIEADGTSKIVSVNLGKALSGDPVENVVLMSRDRLLIHRNTERVDPATVDITGEVAKPGRYPYTTNMRIEDLIRAAGGLKRSADKTVADLTHYSIDGKPAQHLEVSLPSIANANATEDIPLKVGDVVAIRQAPGWKDIGATITVRGEVQHPGSFGIQPGERLSSVLERAGNFNSQAYPYGAVLMRREVREAQETAHADLLRRVQALQANVHFLPEGNQDEKNAKYAALAQSETTLHQLRLSEPIGRVVIHIQEPIQKWKNTSDDVPLRDGDILVVPKKANYILVNGQVFNPTAVSYRPGHSGRWYLNQAGGLTPMADKKAVFVIRADGSVVSAKNNSSGWWSGDPLKVALRPGDTVVVPERGPKIGGPNWTQVMQAAQMASSVALAVAYIHP